MEERTHIVFEPQPPRWAIGVASVIGVVLIVYLGALARNAIKNYDYIGRSDQQIYTISITGEGKVTAVPDIAQFSVGYETTRATVAAAQTENTQKMNKLIGDIKNQGVEDKDIKTIGYSIYPQYSYSANTQRLTGYTVSQQVQIKVRDLEKVSDILQLAGSQGANNVSGLDFTIDEPEDLRQQAREEALTQAKAKAERLADVAGVKLGRLVSFTENSYGYQPPTLYKTYGLESAQNDAAAPAPAVEPGSQEIIINVMVTYEVL